MGAGVVADYDDERGTGAVRSEEGTELFFHCTAIADGTRTIAPGTKVTYEVVPGRLGRWEATEVTAASS